MRGNNVSEWHHATRRKLLGLGGALAAAVVIPVGVDQYIDPVARVSVVPAELLVEIPNGPVLLDRSRWRVVGPTDDGGHPVKLDPNFRCRGCGEAHGINVAPGEAYLIYTIGCRPAALPVGYANGMATFPVTNDAHPSLINVPNCPDGGAPLVPHVHADTDFRWA